MRIAVMGAGGTGGFFGGLLARAGESVTFIARGAHLAALQSRGLAVTSRLAGDFTVPVTATSDPAAVGAVDLVLFCVKAYDTETAAAQIRSLVGPDTMVLSVQNGIDNAERIARVVGEQPVIGGVAQISSVIEAPGVIAQTAGAGRIIFGELAGGSSARTERLLSAFQQAGITAQLHPDIRVALWEKFLMICAFSGLTALTRLPLGSILGCAETRALFRDTMAEVEAIARAIGIRLPAGCVDRTVAMFTALEPWARGSLYYDLAAGRRLELEVLHGTVVRLGGQQGIATPLNFAIYAALKPYVDGAPVLPTP
ncbi:MAG: 2-dehydropantoate 2-reductase [bacterium]